MTYSVWNQAIGRYDYFMDASTSPETSAPRPGHLSPRNELGVTPEQAAWRLPVAARLSGHGPVARGRIASAKAGTSLGAFPDLTIDNLIIGALVVTGIWYIATGKLPWQSIS